LRFNSIGIVNVEEVKKMRTLFFGIVLLSTVLVAIFAQYQEDDFDSDFDSDWFWIGSNLKTVGKPKFKISEHPDGYSMQLGFSGHYMRMRYTDSANSIDFNFMDYKGSAKLKKGDRGPEFEGTLEITGGGERGRLPIDAKIKIKHSRTETGPYPSRRGPYEIEISFVNNYRGDSYQRLRLPSARIRNPKKLEALIKILVNPEKLTESTFSFNMNAKGEAQIWTNEDSYNGYTDYIPANYSLSASIMVINLVESNPRQRQPKMTAALDLEEHLTFEDTVTFTDLQDTFSLPNTPRNQNLFKKSIVIEGMINLTGKGARLGVLKFTDADTDNSIGRIQARRADEENLRLEIFADGQEYGALNFFQNGAGMTNITEENNECLDSQSEYIENISNDTYEAEPVSPSCKTISRVLESVSGNGMYESRIYKDSLLIGSYYRSDRKRNNEGDDGLIFEEKMSEKNGKYEGSIMLSDGWEQNMMNCILNNEGEDTHLQMGVSKKLRYSDEDIVTRTDERASIDITPSTDEKDEFNFKLSYNNERIFDGFFYMTRIIQRYARELIPAMIDRQLATFLDSHDETIRVLSEYV